MRRHRANYFRHASTFPRFPRFIDTTLKSAPHFSMDRRIYRARESWDGRACERPPRARTCYWLTRRRFVLSSVAEQRGGRRTTCRRFLLYPSEASARQFLACVSVRRRACRAQLRMRGTPWELSVVLTGGLLHGSPRPAGL